EARVYVTVLDVLEQRLDVPLNVALAGLQGQSAVDDRAHRKLVDETAIHTNHRHHATVAAGADGFAQYQRPIRLHLQDLLGAVDDVHGSVAMGFQAYGVDAGVGSAATGELHQRVMHLRQLIVDDFG